MEPSCEEKIDGELAHEIQILEKLLTQYYEDPDACTEEYGNLEEYGLCFDYVAPCTFPDQVEGYFRYQLSFGGPSDEFRFYTNPDFSVHRIEYVYMEWYDIAKSILYGKNYKLLNEIYERLFAENGTTNSVYDDAMEVRIW